MKRNVLINPESEFFFSLRQSQFVTFVFFSLVSLDGVDEVKPLFSQITYINTQLP